MFSLYRKCFCKEKDLLRLKAFDTLFGSSSLFCLDFFLFSRMAIIVAIESIATIANTMMIANVILCLLPGDNRKREANYS